MDFLNLASTRIKLIWCTFVVWYLAMFWYLAVVPIVREFFKTCYAASVNLDSDHATTILGMTGTAFGLTVGTYIASKWTEYRKPDGTIVEEIEEPTNKTHSQEA